MNAVQYVSDRQITYTEISYITYISIIKSIKFNRIIVTPKQNQNLCPSKNLDGEQRCMLTVEKER